MKYTTALLIAFLSLFPAGWAISATHTVISSIDSHDANPGDGLCRDADGFCTLRAAVEEANLSPYDTVLISGGLDPILLHLGAILITGAHISIAGIVSTAIIDGRYNPDGTDNFEIRGIGCHIWNCTIAHSRRHGVRVLASAAVIGAPNTKTILVGNGLTDSASAAISIEGVAQSGIIVSAVWIGLKGSGTVIEPNQTGIRILRSSQIIIGGNNPIERNLISGNIGHGILIDIDSRQVSVIGNYIGLDLTGRGSAPNSGNGVKISGGSKVNRIGGPALQERNLISANIGNGIEISGQETDSNLIAGNFIGLDSTGFFDVGNNKAGVRVCRGASHNRIGFDSAGTSMHLVVAGSYSNGIEILDQDTDSNIVDWSYIGLDGNGNGNRPNGLRIGQGVYIGQGARFNWIGQEANAPRNVISGNFGPGICIAGSGTSLNVVAGNYIGASRFGNSPMGNSAGVVIRDSARFNLIGTSTTGNLISGNRGDLFPLGGGVVIFGQLTDYNTVQQNLIGCDYTGTRAMRNRSAGVIIGGGAAHNLIGGDSTACNLISGNGALPVVAGLGTGVHLFGQGTDSNTIAGNLIGVAADKSTLLPNNGHGISIFGGAGFTVIGGSPGRRNIIAKNKHTGVWVEGPFTVGHQIRLNSIFDNDSGGIAVRNGANQSPIPPIILGLSTNSVWGSCGVANAMVDVYRSRMNSSGKIQGITFLGEALSDLSGAFSCQVAGLVSGDSVTAVLTTPGIGSSEFSGLSVLPVPTEVIELTDTSGHEATLYQNTPNPFNNNTLIPFFTDKPSVVSIVIFNLNGQHVKTLSQGFMPLGRHMTSWDGTNSEGESVASGIYFYRMDSPTPIAVRKMILLK